MEQQLSFSLGPDNLSHSVYQASGVHSISSLLAYLPHHHSRRGQKGGRKRGRQFFSCPSTALFCEKCITQIQGRASVNGKHRDDRWMVGWMDGWMEGKRWARTEPGVTDQKTPDLTHHKNWILLIAFILQLTSNVTFNKSFCTLNICFLTYKVRKWG